MKLNIGETIKRLRKEKDITQEEFAEVFGVSCQSVSRWETGLCYPDIELIPAIAAFFGISADKLLGVDKETEEAAVRGILDSFQAAISVGRIDDCIDIARRGVAEFPNDFRLLNKLMYALFVSGSDDANIPDWKENMEKYDAEIVSLGERIIKHCPDIEIRLEATARLAFQHCEMGRKSIGRAVYETMPTMTHCREIAIWQALEENEKIPHTRELIGKAYSLLVTGMYRLTFLLSDEDAIKIFQKIKEIERIICDGEIYEGQFHNCKHNYLLAKHYMKLGNTNEALRHIALAAKAANDFDNRPEERRTYSLLLGEQVDKRTDFDTADTRPLVQILREMWLRDNAFDCIRDSTEFKKLLG